ncbi:glycerate kinase [uncultured Rothia sp.]|uniref:glycerate kinase n=1 Tax=uncultured Rothia sp. TaxID=316088 RepID=UPI0032179CDF
MSRRKKIPLGGIHLHIAQTIDLSGLSPKIGEVRLDLSLNQHAVPYVQHGFARMFAPPKRATAEQVEALS